MINKKYTETLFLDRDGVINTERKDDYVKNISEFDFIAGSLEAIAILSTVYRRIFIVTNQRGVGRGLMAKNELDEVHRYMFNKIEENNGRIDGIYTCFDICSTSVNRKPNIGMAFQVQRDFPETVFHRSTMVGNSFSDMQFGQKLGMYTVLVGDKYPKEDKIYRNISAYFPNLLDFALSLEENK